MTAAPKRKIAVVLFNLGGPDRQEAVSPFLFNLFSDPEIIRLPAPARLPLAAFIAWTRGMSARQNYAKLGGSSPLMTETTRQAVALQTQLAAMLPGDETRVFIAMRYWTPLTKDAAREVQAWGADEVLLLPLYPQFSTTTTRSSFKAWREAYAGRAPQHAVCCYPDTTDFAKAHAALIRETWDKGGRPERMRLLFSAHGLPQGVVDGGDPYEMQVQKTCAAVLEALGADGLGADWDWRLCYQSRVGRLKWLGPYTEEAIESAAHDGRGVIITPIAFVSEHVETLIELDDDYARLAEELGAQPYLRVPALGPQSDFITALAKAAIGALSRTGVAPAGTPCGQGWSQCACVAAQRGKAA